ncbi:farnesyl pyrophosphate synthase-like [Oppia nitens]|uniref:farnesyl pyrophosphate synthase-like n=1 Tax=Oppia nitens TaxID=1686743 RepID=UPI0023D9B5A3|nr:farnesyl pyrophosphate synthase-like [Oppia nitens]
MFAFASRIGIRSVMRQLVPKSLMRPIDRQSSNLRLFWTQNSKLSLYSSDTSLNHNDLEVDTFNVERQELIAFDETYRRVFKDMIPNTNELELNESFRWIEKVVDYNVPNGKRNRGLALVMSYRMLAPIEEQTSENLELARILGWAVELLQAYFLIVDDLVDQSITRRGQLCWYRQDGVGLIACNDAILLESCIYYIIKHHFKDKSYYIDILDLMLETTRYTSYGQCLDLLSNPPSKGYKADLRSFTIERYAAIVKYKTAFYSFCLPVRLSMFMSNLSDPAVHTEAEKILLKMGHFFQVQDDYLDCFGDPQVIGKVGTDIQDGKCCWPVITALQNAIPEQRQIIEDNYGINTSEAVAKVKAIYKDLNIEELYRKYEDMTFDEICQLIDELTVSSKLPKNIFYGFLSKIHRRIK